MIRTLLLLPIAATLVAASPVQEWPEPNHSHINSPDRIAQGAVARVTNGMTKAQVWRILGFPHFSEGMGARTWHYWLAYGAQECRLRVSFERSRVVGTTWDKPGCAAVAG